MAKVQPKKAFRKLYEIAESQGGFFTTKQAIASGYAEKTHVYQAKAGHWIRRHRGIYQLVHFPDDHNAELILWSLWSRNRQDIPQGVYSHETALSIHELSDVNPAKIHMTVPKSFRKFNTVPPVLILHRDELPKSSIESRHGYAVVKPLTVILEFVNTGLLSTDLLEQSLRQALRRGIIRQSEIKNIHLKEAAQQRWQSLLDKIRKN
jgi:hypothetical protein